MLGYDAQVPTGLLGGMAPKDIGILQAALMGLQASGPSRMPVSMGQIMGQAGNAGMNAYQQAQEQQKKAEMFKLQMAQYQQAQAEKKKRDDAISALAKDPRFAGMENLLAVSPTAAIERAYPKDKNPLVVPPGSTVVSPTDPSKTLFTAPTKPERPSSIGQMIQERDLLPIGHPQREVYDAAIRKATTHAPAASATVINKQETEFGKAVGKKFGEQYVGLMEADMAAPGTIARYQRLGSLLGDVKTGKFQGTIVDLKAAAKSLGVDLTALGVRDDVAPAQAADALSKQMALDLRNPAGGAGMPGALSDKDREFLVKMVPSIENDPDAVKQMIEYRVKLAKREQDVARMAREYRNRTGKFDEGFFTELRAFSDKNPLFTAGGPKPTLSPGVIRFLKENNIPVPGGG